MRIRFSATVEMRWPGSQIVGGWSVIFSLGLIIILPGRLIVLHSVFMSALVDSTKESKSSSLSSMIVWDVSDETLITTRKYVIMIATVAIFTDLSRVYCSLHAFLSRDAKINEQNSFRAYIQRIFNSSLPFWL